jgi:hypothetical protein
LPYRGNAQMQVRQRVTDDAPNVRSLNRHVPLDLATICAKCLERSPAARYQTAKQVADELRRYLNNVPIHARPISRPARFVRWTKRNPLLATVAALIFFLAVAGPTAAVVIAGQRNRLGELVVEKDNLINTSQRSLDRYAEENSRLKRDIEIEAGRESPWQIWQEAREAKPRRMLIADLYKHSQEQLQKAIDDKQLSDADRCRALLALAMMTEASGTNGNNDAAKVRLQAIGLLKRLADERPSVESIDDALTQTIDDYSKVAGLKNSDEDGFFEQSRARRQRAAEAHPDDLKRQIAWFESEMRSAASLERFDRLPRLMAAEKIRTSLKSQWPNDIADIYRLTCFLAEKDCPLAKTEALPNAVPKATESSD